MTVWPGARCQLNGHRVSDPDRACGQRWAGADLRAPAEAGLERWSPTPTCSPMRTAISSLRRKLGDDGKDPTYIFTELRVGYRMPKADEQGEEPGTEPPSTP